MLSVSDRDHLLEIGFSREQVDAWVVDPAPVVCGLGVGNLPSGVAGISLSLLSDAQWQHVRSTGISRSDITSHPDAIFYCSPDPSAPHPAVPATLSAPRSWWETPAVVTTTPDPARRTIHATWESPTTSTPTTSVAVSTNETPWSFSKFARAVTTTREPDTSAADLAGLNAVLRAITAETVRRDATTDTTGIAESNARLAALQTQLGQETAAYTATVGRPPTIVQTEAGGHAVATEPTASRDTLLGLSRAVALGGVAVGVLAWLVVRRVQRKRRLAPRRST